MDGSGKSKMLQLIYIYNFFVCLLVCGGLMEIQTSAPILMTKEGFGAGLTSVPATSPIWA